MSSSFEKSVKGATKIKVCYDAVEVEVDMDATVYWYLSPNG